LERERTPVETVNQLEAGFWELLEAFQSVSAELARFKETSQVADHALKLALDLTRSSVAYIGLVDESVGGFEETIRDRVAMMRSLTGIEAEIELELPDELAYEFKSMLFRQVTESLTNVEKHAAATRGQLSMKAVDGAVHGLVIDNGRGFVVSERDRLPGHLGLLALNERSLLAGGWTRIESEPGLGTRIEFWMPIA